MKSFEGKIAVITGGGTGMGRALARQLVREGAHVALCDVSVENMVETQRLCEDENPHDVRVSCHECDVAVEDQVLAFRDAVLRDHETAHVHLLFNNAGIGGGGSFVHDDRDRWERTFDICWNGVYYCSRAFLEPLIQADEAHLVNTSSVNGFWASLGPKTAHTAYSAAKFAVKGFSEALVNDFRLNAPHVKVSVVMPGHIGTEIGINSGLVLGVGPALEMSEEDVHGARRGLIQQGVEGAEEMSDDQVRAWMDERGRNFRDEAPTSSEQAADIILQGVRDQQWRILVGDDAHVMDAAVRNDPATAYEESFLDRLLELRGILAPEVTQES